MSESNIDSDDRFCDSALRRFHNLWRASHADEDDDAPRHPGRGDGGAIMTAPDGYFDLDRIVEPYPVADLFATRCGYLDMLPGPNLRMWFVLDHPTDQNGNLGASELRARIVCPIETIQWLRRVDAWIMQQGVLLPSKGAPIIRPAGTTVM